MIMPMLTPEFIAIVALLAVLAGLILAAFVVMFISFFCWYGMLHCGRKLDRLITRLVDYLER